MIKTFADSGTRDIAAGKNTAAARKALPTDLYLSAQRKMAVIDRARSLKDIYNIPGYRFEKLTGDRKGHYSIRINKQYRICFNWDGENAFLVEITDYH